MNKFEYFLTYLHKDRYECAKKYGSSYYDIEFDELERLGIVFESISEQKKKEFAKDLATNSHINFTLSEQGFLNLYEKLVEGQELVYADDPELKALKEAIYVYDDKSSPYVLVPECFSEAFGTPIEIGGYLLEEHQQRGGVDQGSEYWVILKVTDKNTTEQSYWKLNGWYSSYEGQEITEAFEVEPYEVKKIEWRKKK